MNVPTMTYSIFETGAYKVPSKSQNPTVLGQGGPSSTQCSHTSRAYQVLILYIVFFF
jgi:hypothetical protein